MRIHSNPNISLRPEFDFLSFRYPFDKISIYIIRIYNDIWILIRYIDFYRIKKFSTQNQSSLNNFFIVQGSSCVNKGDCTVIPPRVTTSKGL